MEILNYYTSYKGFDQQDYFSEVFFGKPNKPVPTDYRCCLCGEPFIGYGNNPAPLTNILNLRCCDSCNQKYVIPARMEKAKGDKPTIVMKGVSAPKKVLKRRNG